MEFNTNQKIHCLLVEDDVDDQEFFSMAVAELNYDIDCRIAGSGKQAIELLQQTAFFPDVIFMDLNMPAMDGKTCLAMIRNDPKYVKIPIIMLSTSISPL